VRPPLLLAAVAALLLVPAAGGSQALIRPGKSIAGVALGMSEADVRAKLGRPTHTIRRRAGFGRVEVELQFDDADYTVRLTGRRGALRAVAVTTILRRERTPDGLGVGTSESVLLRRLGRSIRCEALRTRREGPYVVVAWQQTSRRCVTRAPSGGETVWVTSPRIHRHNLVVLESEWLALARVIEVEVRRSS
jgi:hypothetical protein